MFRSVMKLCVLFALLWLSQYSLAQSSPRVVIDFNKDWKFRLEDSAAVIDPFDPSALRTVNLPHDWSIESNFSKKFPATSQGGALPGGIGSYQKTFELPANGRGKNVSIEFDGVYRNCEVWINGNYLGKRPNGYISFHYDLTSYINYAPSKNMIVVKVDNSQQPNSRWYTGSGIYRDVKLELTIPYASVARSGTFITTYDISKKEAYVNIVTVLSSTTEGEKSISIRNEIPMTAISAIIKASILRIPRR